MGHAEADVKLTESMFLVLDTETTGPDPDRDHVIQLGGAMFVGRELRGRYTSLIRSDWVPLDAYKVHGISIADVEKAPELTSVWPKFRHQATHAQVFVSYNGRGFDWPILKADCVRSDIDYSVIDTKPHVDVMEHARWHFRGLRERNLVSICAHMHVDMSRGDAHTAGVDAERTGRLALAMVDAGKMPDDVDEAIELGTRYRKTRDAEFEEFSWWFYRDNVTGALMVGAGKYTGTRFDDVPRKYWKYLLKFDDLPRNVRRMMENA